MQGKKRNLEQLNKENKSIKVQLCRCRDRQWKAKGLANELNKLYKNVRKVGDNKTKKTL